MPEWMTSLLDLVGIVFVVIGVGLWSPAAAWIVAGLLLVAFSLREERNRPPRSEPPS